MVTNYDFLILKKLNLTAPLKKKNFLLHWFPQVEFGYEMQGVTFYVHCCKQQQNLTLPTSLYFVELYGNILFYMVENNCYVHFYLYGFILPDVYHRSYL